MSQGIGPNGKLRSESVVVASPMSYAGSGKRIWKITNQENQVLSYLLMPVAITIILMAWSIVTIWYCIFGLLLVPYRLIRRSGRKEKKLALQHREQLEALTAIQTSQVIQTANLIEQNKPKNS
jgi:hypothetical protein